jgi:hypothetical protein
MTFMRWMKSQSEARMRLLNLAMMAILLNKKRQSLKILHSAFLPFPYTCTVWVATFFPRCIDDGIYSTSVRPWFLDFVGFFQCLYNAMPELTKRCKILENSGKYNHHPLDSPVRLYGTCTFLPFFLYFNSRGLAHFHEHFFNKITQKKKITTKHPFI